MFAYQHTHVCQNSSVVCRVISRSSWLFTAFARHDVAVASLLTRALYRAAKPGRVPCCLEVEKISVMGNDGNVGNLLKGKDMPDMGMMGNKDSKVFEGIPANDQCFLICFDAFWRLELFRHWCINILLKGMIHVGAMPIQFRDFKIDHPQEYRGSCRMGILKFPFQNTHV